MNIKVFYKKIVCALSALAICVSLVGCGGDGGQNIGPVLLSPKGGEVAEILPATMQAYIDAQRSDPENTWVNNYECRYEGTPLTLYWKEDASPSYVVRLSTERDMSNAKQYIVNEPFLELNNLYADTEYYWTVASSSGISETGRFKTKDTTRWLNVEGIANVRDLGNYVTNSGAKIKQGMLYRGTELNYRYNVTEKGVATMLDELKIKTEIDLRWGNQTSEEGPLTKSPLGETVNYFNLPIAPYGEINTPVYNNYEDENYPVETRASLRRIFTEILTNEASYPIYFHCYIGADRTGTLAFLISGLLGVGYDDLICDYEQTTFGVELRTRATNYYYGNELRKFRDVLRSYGRESDKDDWQRLCTEFLMDYVGVTRSEIAKIKEILL